MRVAIIGYGVEGRASHVYWGAQGHELTICDRNQALELDPALPPAALKLGDDYLEGLEAFDLLVRSPSVRPDLLPEGAPVTSGTREFFARCPAPIIGVTGTNGKGTTSSLITEMLRGAGRRVHLGGNIGVPALDLLPETKPDDIVVLELSSFQLMDLDRSPHIAVGLMMSPDHLNWHKDMDEYVEAKRNLFRYQSEGDLAVHHPDNPYTLRLVAGTPGRHVPYLRPPGADVRDGYIVMEGERICAVSEAALMGAHNLENICAAVTATWEISGRNKEAAARAIRTFAGLPHRLEKVGVVDGVTYINDSISTTPITAIAAIRSLPGPKVMILGGSEKGSDFSELGQVVQDGNVIHVFLVGVTAPRIAKALDEAGFSHYTMIDWKGMDELVRTCRSITEPGDVVLLSPACASYDMFPNFGVRGDQFRAAVKALPH